VLELEKRPGDLYWKVFTGGVHSKSQLGRLLFERTGLRER
jgi:hypothetical protein